MGHVPQTLIAQSIEERAALIHATTDLAQLPERIICITCLSLHACPLEPTPIAKDEQLKLPVFFRKA